MDYSHIFGSQFPNELIPIGTKKDIDNSIKNLVIQYYDYVDAGDITSAYELYTNNKDLLSDYIINMEYINRLEEEIYNIGLKVLKEETNEISETEPIDQAEDAYWYQDY